MYVYFLSSVGFILFNVEIYPYLLLGAPLMWLMYHFNTIPLFLLLNKIVQIHLACFLSQI